MAARNIDPRVTARLFLVIGVALLAIAALCMGVLFGTRGSPPDLSGKFPQILNAVGGIAFMAGLLSLVFGGLILLVAWSESRSKPPGGKGGG